MNLPLLIILSACNTCETVSIVINGITTLGVVIALVALFVSRRAAYFSAIEKCTNDFRYIVRKMQRREESIDILQYDFLGLFNEQLFYIKNGYIPYEIAVEWLCTIYKYLECKDKCLTFTFDDYHIASFDKVRKFRNKYTKKYRVNCDNARDIHREMKEIYRKEYKLTLLRRIKRRFHFYRK